MQIIYFINGAKINRISMIIINITALNIKNPLGKRGFL